MIKKLIAVYLTITLIVLNGMFLPSYAGGKYGKIVKLKHLRQEDTNKPVYILGEDIFFAGGQDTDTKRIIFPKIYNTYRKTVKNINRSMKVPRNDYNAIFIGGKYYKVLIVGGTCVEEVPDCAKVAEIFDTRTKRFTRVDNAKLDFNDNGMMYQYNDTIILVNSLGIQEFDIENKTFSVVHKFDENYKHIIYSTHFWGGNIYIWGIKYNPDKTPTDDFNISLMYSGKNKTLEPVEIVPSEDEYDNAYCEWVLLNRNKRFTKLCYDKKKDEKEEIKIIPNTKELNFALPENTTVVLASYNNDYIIASEDLLDPKSGKPVRCIIYNPTKKKPVVKTIKSEKIRKIHVVPLGWDSPVFVSGYKDTPPMLIKYKIYWTYSIREWFFASVYIPAVAIILIPFALGISTVEVIQDRLSKDKD